jgi:hypothetical protein
MLRPSPISLLSQELYAPCVVRLLKTIRNLSMDEKCSWLWRAFPRLVLRMLCFVWHGTCVT